MRGAETLRLQSLAFRALRLSLLLLQVLARLLLHALEKKIGITTDLGDYRFWIAHFHDCVFCLGSG